MAPLTVWIKDKIHGWRPQQRPRPTEMKLGEDMQFYWNTELGGYVERGREVEYQAASKPVPPPAMATTPSIRTPRPRGRHYVPTPGSLVPTVPIPVSVPTVVIPSVIPASPVHVPVPTVVTPSMSMTDPPIDLATYDWDATLAEFEATVHGKGWLYE